MKSFFSLLITCGMSMMLFSQSKQNIENDIKDIVSYLKDDNLNSFYDKFETYDQYITTYLIKGDTLSYNKLTDSSNYKYYNTSYKDNILRSFLDCRKDYLNDDKKLRIDWNRVELKQILIEEFPSDSNSKTEKFVNAKILISERRNKNDYIINVGLNYSKLRKLISFRFLENIYTGFPTIERYLKIKTEEEKLILKNANIISSHQGTLKRYEPSESDSKNQFQKTYISEDGHSSKLVLNFEKNDDNTVLKSVERIIGDNIKHTQSFSRWEKWNGILVFNPYKSKTTWYIYENDKKLICFSIDSDIIDVNKLEKFILKQTKNE
ncbi:hypothetical protein [Epilithonimonas sp. UC225_85]|uniref:hypothetical protein n=1 Tax=Epilithonimonas sp. UC225_85 TaxID=3350167 RepID=UPI0036D2090C